MTRRRYSRRKRHTRRKRGGSRCVGTGIGANTLDPNYSLYNSRLGKLFPWQ